MTQDNEKLEPQNQEEHEGSWSSNYAAEENLKQRKYSRTSRNKVSKEGSKMSKILLGVLFMVVLTPFLLFWLVSRSTNQAQTETTPKTAEQVVLSRNESTTVSETTATTSDQSTTISSVDLNTTMVEVTSAVAEVTQAPTPAVTQAPSGRTHTVEAGQTMYGIARTYGVDVYALAQANGMTIESQIVPGQTLIIP